MASMLPASSDSNGHINSRRAIGVIIAIVAKLVIIAIVRTEMKGTIVVISSIRSN